MTKKAMTMLLGILILRIIGDTEGNENYGNGENDELLSNGHDSGNMDLYYNFNNNE